MHSEEEKFSSFSFLSFEMFPICFNFPSVLLFFSLDGKCGYSGGKANFFLLELGLFELDLFLAWLGITHHTRLMYVFFFRESFVVYGMGIA